jgi:hypothetical protein
MENTLINLELNVAQINIIMQVLAQAPYATVADLISNIREQASIQLSSAAQTPENTE